MPVLKYISGYRNLPREVYVLFIARVINRIGDFVKAFLTLFLTQKLDFTEKETGTVIMLVAGANMLGSVAGGKLGDSIGRKKIMIIMMSGFSLSLALAGFFIESPYISLFIIIAAVFNGAERPLNNTIVADVTTGDKRAKSYSLMYLGANIGVAIGPMIAGFLFLNYIRWIFWGDAITTILAIALIIRLVPETKMSEEEMKEKNHTLPESERAEKGSVFSALKTRPILCAMAVLMIVSSFIYSQNAFTLPLHLAELFPETSAKYYGYIMSANAIVVLILTPFLMSATSKVSSIKAIAGAQFLYALGMGMLYFEGSFFYFLVSTVVWTMGEIITVTHFNVFVASHTPVSHRSRINGMLMVTFGLGHTFSPFISGIWVEAVEIIEIWKYVFIMGLVLSLLMIILDIYDHKRYGANK